MEIPILVFFAVAMLAWLLLPTTWFANGRPERAVAKTDDEGVVASFRCLKDGRACACYTPCPESQVRFIEAFTRTSKEAEDARKSLRSRNRRSLLRGEAPEAPRQERSWQVMEQRMQRREQQRKPQRKQQRKQQHEQRHEQQRLFD